MSDFSPIEPFERLKTQTLSAIQSHFPLEGKKHTVVLEKAWIDDNRDIDDIQSQKDAKLKGRTWGVPIRAELKVIDNATGKVLDHQTTSLGTLPKITRRYSYVVDGSEWQVPSQFRLKSGVYTRRRENGEVTSQWNLAKGLGFDMDFAPESKRLSLKYNQSNIPLLPVLKTLGVSEAEIKKRWSPSLLAANATTPEKEDRAIRQLHKKMFGGAVPKDMDEVRSQVREGFAKTELRPDSTADTLGKPFERVDGTSLLYGSEKLLKVQRGDAEIDDRDNPAFKDFLGAEDMLEERLASRKRWDIKRKLLNRLDKKDPKVDRIVSPDTFGKQIKQFFTNSAIAERPTQLNPMSMIGQHRRTTLSGEGGIQGEHTITLEAQSIHPGQTGFLDPIQTPESSRIGTVLQMASATRKNGKNIEARVYNLRTGKEEWITPSVANKSVMAFPDQFDWDGGKPKPRSNEVKALDKDNEYGVFKPNQVDYVFRSRKGMFDIAANMIPFLASDQGNRTMVAAKQAEQAVSLVHREAPLVQTKGEGDDTFENALGSFNSHTAPVEGTVKKVTPEGIVIRDAKGKTHTVQLYDNFPLNDDKSVLNSEALVKVGDKVKPGQVVADTNFTKGGTLALGTNLSVLYTPYKGYNFEDGITISRSAAKKLTSEQMTRHGITLDKKSALSKKQFLAHTAGQVTKKQADKLDDNGIIKPGQIVEPGDVLIGRLTEAEDTEEQRALRAISGKVFKGLKAQPEVWNKDYPGEVVRVVRSGKDTTVYVKAFKPAQIGDKIVGRHGNKGIVTQLLEDEEMPRNKDGSHAEVILNPTGIPTRINEGQALETAAGKIAEKLGKPYVVDNFDPKVKDNTRKVIADGKKYGVEDEEEFFDPKTGRRLGKGLFGKQYILKLHHTAEKGISSRGWEGGYDANMVPSSGGSRSGQTMDANGMYALLAHGARANLQEMQSTKSDKNDDFWFALQEGNQPPPPKVPFAYKKFEGYLRGMGVNVEKKGSRIHYGPMTDKQVEALAGGRRVTKLDRGLMNNTKSDVVPEKGGIFDPKATGTKSVSVDGLGTKWSYAELASRVPNPIFEPAARALLGLTEAQYNEVIKGSRSLDGKTGPEAISSSLANIDRDKELAELEPALKTLKGGKKSAASKKIRYLRALKHADVSVADAYTMKKLPVLPPNMRPPVVLDSGNISQDDLSDQYNQIGKVNDQVAKAKELLHITGEDDDYKALHASLYDGVKSLTLTGMSFHGRHRKGIAELIGGASRQSPKEGFFQKRVIGKRQNLSARGVIVPEPTLGMDEMALPRKAAKTMYEPFVVRRLVREHGLTPGQAKKQARSGSPLATRVLEDELEKRPVLMKRDPVLHQYGVQAFLPRLTDETAIKIHPLATSGFNADFDGDKMGVFVPVSAKATKEAFGMLPSRNLFSPSHGKVMFAPTQESMQGLYDLSKMSRTTTKRYRTAKDAYAAMAKGEISPQDIITVDDPKGGAGRDDNPLIKTAAAQRPVRTTVGRMMIAEALPEDMRTKEVYSSRDFLLTKSKIGDVLTQVGKKKDPGEFGRTADEMKDLGNAWATGFSFGLKDLVSQSRIRDQILAKHKPAEQRIRAMYKNKEARREALVEHYGKVDDELQRTIKPIYDKSNNRMYDWVRSGARGKWSQFSDMVVGPLLVVDSKGKTVPVAIDKSYSEGLDMAGYFASLNGARMGTIGRVKGTAEPGARTKEMVQTSMDQLISADDCGTTRGLNMPLDRNDVVDRVIAEDIKLGVRGGKDKGTIVKGTLMTQEVRDRLRRNGVKDVTVRSPLRCEEGGGVCSKCFGLNEEGQFHNKGVNVGVRAAHALGEPMTQMAMNAFHCNHAHSLVFVQTDEEKTLCVTMEDLFYAVPGDAQDDGEEEVKAAPPGWRIWDGMWVELTHVRRHAPSRPMRVVGDGGLITICQDNHPLGVWRSSWSDPEFVPPSEIDKKAHTMHRDLSLVRHLGRGELEWPGYVVGLFLAEGNVTFKRSHKKMKEKKPYAVYWSQKDGPVKDALNAQLEELGWNPKATSRGITVNSLDLGTRFHEMFGRYSFGKALPPTFLELSEEYLLQVMAGIIDGDGTVERHEDGPDCIGVDTTSFALAQQIVFFFLGRDIHATLTPTPTRELTRNQGYKVRIRMTETSVALLRRAGCLKVESVEKLSSASQHLVVGHRKVNLNREVMYANEFVYDATTSTGTLYVSGLFSHNTGGRAGAKGSDVKDTFKRMGQLIEFPEKLPGSAPLSRTAGVVQKVQKDRDTGGYNVFVDGKKHFVQSDRGEPVVRVGQKLTRGQPLSKGPINPRELLVATGSTSAVQRYLTDEMASLYGNNPLHRRNTETFVRALTNVAEVEDPGDNTKFLPGDRAPLTELEAWNRTEGKGRKPMRIKPLLKGTNVLPLEGRTDVMARLQFRDLKKTLSEGSGFGWHSDIHGSHPIPALAYAAEFGEGTEKEPWKY